MIKRDKKRNFNISPQKNKEVKKYKKSRERDRRYPTFKNTTISH